jgi:hypothetical protein
MKKGVLTALLGIIVVLSPLVSQEISKRKEIAVFRLNSSDWRVPTSALTRVDEQIKRVFINLGRFDVIGMEYRLQSSSIDQFIRKIREYKGNESEIPEEVRLGREAFTETDFNRLTGSFIVAVPIMDYYSLEYNDDGDVVCQMETSFTFINIQEEKSFAHITVATSGLDEDANDAIQEAANAISGQLSYRIRTIPEFQLKTGIVDVLGWDVVLEFGSNMGVKPGDEYAIIESGVLSSGHQVSEETGLLIVKQVRREVSVAQVIYANNPPMVGDQLKEIPKAGIETDLYVHAIINPITPSPMVITPGLMFSVTRGFYGLRPVFGLEIPLIWTGINGIPLNIMLGARYDIYFGRFQLVPMAVGGLVGSFYTVVDEYAGEEEEVFHLTHAGFKAMVSLNYLLGKSVRLSLDGGYSYWFSLFPNSWKDYGGITAGLSINFLY